jgi:hypothetical protein
MANTGPRGDTHDQLEGMFKMSVQQGRSYFDARSVHEVREHGKMARTPLAAFFNIPTKNNPLSPNMGKPLTILRHRSSFF